MICNAYFNHLNSFLWYVLAFNLFLIRQTFVLFLLMCLSSSKLWPRLRKTFLHNRPLFNDDKHPLKFSCSLKSCFNIYDFCKVMQQLESPSILYTSLFLLKFKTFPLKNIMNKNKYNTYHFSSFWHHKKIRKSIVKSKAKW